MNMRKKEQVLAVEGARGPPAIKKENLLNSKHATEILKTLTGARK